MRKILYILALTVLVLLVTACKKRREEPEVSVWQIEFLSETIVKGSTSAELTVSYDCISEPESVVGYLSRNSDMSNATQVSGMINDNVFVVRFLELQVNTEYYYQIECSNGIDLVRKDTKSFMTNDCDKPIVKTDNVTFKTVNSAMCGGTVIDDGGLEVTARGVCWSMSVNPTTNDPHTVDGSGTGYFTSILNDLDGVYYVRAYATNSKGTAYGEQKIYDNPIFSVSSSEKVYFSKGNLQYNASVGWRFAEHQWDYAGGWNTSGWVDLFGWGAWGEGKNPLNTSQYAADYEWSTDFKGTIDGRSDWRTLIKDEWEYVINLRSTVSGIRFAKAVVNGVNGMILLPDYWSSDYYNLSSTNQGSANFSSNVITQTEWVEELESNGAVFLPVAGFRLGTSVHLAGSNGYYWSAPCDDNPNVYYLFFFKGYIYNGYWYYRSNGRSVRLVAPVV